MANPNQDARGPHTGRYERTLDTAARDAEAADLRAKGWTYQRIADHFGWASHASAIYAVQRTLDAVVREPGEAVRYFELSRLDAELGRLDDLEAEARRVLKARHVMVNNGRVILHPETGNPMDDDGPVLQALDRLLKIEDARRRNGERRAKLTGIEAAVKVDATVTEVTQEDVALRELVTEMRAKNAAVEEKLRADREQHP